MFEIRLNQVNFLFNNVVYHSNEGLIMETLLNPLLTEILMDNV